jgi:hypothetical protein
MSVKCWRRSSSIKTFENKTRAHHRRKCKMYPRGGLFRPWIAALDCSSHSDVDVVFLSAREKRGKKKIGFM